MGTAASAVGLAAGFASGLESARQRRLGEEELKSQHAREDLADEATRFNLQTARDELPRRRAREDLETESTQFSLENARSAAQRATTNYDQQQAELRRRTEEEGMGEFVRALESGADPQFAMQRYNERGSHKIQSVQYDPASKRLHVVSPDGNGFNGTLPQLKSALGMQDPLLKLGKDDRLVDPRTHQTLVAPDTRPSTTTYAQFLVPLAQKLASGQSLTPGEQRAADLLQHTGVLDRMLNEAGAGGPRSPAPAGNGNDDQQLIRDARDAISQGADRNAVRKRLTDLGIDPDDAGI